MVGRGAVRAFGATSVAFVLLCVGFAGVSAAQAECTVEVSPRAGSAGTVFTFSGTGFTPTRLTLHKDDVAAGGHDLDVGDDDPWEVSIRSRPGDEGTWSAELSSDECSAVAQFRVTLANTDATSDSPGRSPARPTVVALFALLAAGLVGGKVLGRRLEPRARDNRNQ